MVVISLTIVIVVSVLLYKCFVAKYRTVKERGEPDEKSPSLLDNIGDKLSEAIPHLRRRKESEQAETLLTKGLDQLKNREWQELQDTLTPTFVSSKMRSMSERISRCSKVGVDIGDKSIRIFKRQ